MGSVLTHSWSHPPALLTSSQLVFARTHLSQGTPAGRVARAIVGQRLLGVSETMIAVARTWHFETISKTRRSSKTGSDVNSPVRCLHVLCAVWDTPGPQAAQKT